MSSGAGGGVTFLGTGAGARVKKSDSDHLWSGAGIDFSKEGPKPERSRSQFFIKRLVCLLLIIIIADCFLQSMLQHNLQMCKTTSQEVLKFLYNLM